MDDPFAQDPDPIKIQRGGLRFPAPDDVDVADYVGICDRCGLPVYEDNWQAAEANNRRLHATCPTAVKDTAAENKTLVRYDLIPDDVTELLAKLYGFGAEKYSPRNWERGFPWSTPYNALQRHLAAFQRGEELDDGPTGSGLPHIIAVIWNAYALAHFSLNGTGTDDRPCSEAP